MGMKTIFCALCAFMALTPAFSQDTLVLTLEEALRRGTSHSYELRNQELNLRGTALEAARLEARRAPVLGAGGDLRSNLILPTTIIPGSVFSNQGQGEGDRKVRFGTVFNISATLDATYPLIDPTLSADRQLADARRALQGSVLEVQKKQVRLQISEAWYEVFLSEEQLRLAADKLQRARDLLAVTYARRDAGTALPSDLLRSQLEVENGLAAYEQASYQLAAARQALAHRTGITLSTPLRTAGMPAPEAPRPLPAAQPEKRAEIAEYQQRLAISELEAGRIEKQYQPSLNLYGSAAIQHLSNNFSVWQNWFPLAFVGLQAKVALFDGQLKRRDQEIAEVKRMVAQQDLEKRKEDIAFEVSTAETAVQQSVVQWNKAQANLAAGRQLFALDRERFAQGKLTYSELLNTDYALREAERNALSAWYNYLLARARWERAAGI